MASLPNSPAKKAKGKTPFRGGIVAKKKTLSAAGPEEGEAKSSRAAKDTASQIKPPSSGASVARQGRVVFEWFYSVTRRNNFVGGTCAPPIGNTTETYH